MAEVDASVVIKWFANEQNSEEALLLKEAYAKGLEDLSAPCILPFEVLNGLKYTGPGVLWERWTANNV